MSVFVSKRIPLWEMYHDHSFYLEAGKNYIFEVRNLSEGADPVLMLSQKIQGWYTKSRILEITGSWRLSYTPDSSEDYNFDLFASNRFATGECDLFLYTDGGEPVKLNEYRIPVGGYFIAGYLESDVDIIATKEAPALLGMLVIYGNDVFYLQAEYIFKNRELFNYTGECSIIVHSWHYSPGYTTISITRSSYLNDFEESDFENTSDQGWSVPQWNLSENFLRYWNNLGLVRRELSALSLAERRNYINKLEKEFLSEEEIKQINQPSPKTKAPEKVLQRWRKYHDLFNETIPKLKGFSFVEQKKEMLKLSIEKKLLFGARRSRNLK